MFQSLFGDQEQRWQDLALKSQRALLHGQVSLGWIDQTVDLRRPLFPPSFFFIVFLATEVWSCFPGKPDCMTGMWLLQLQKSKSLLLGPQWPQEAAQPITDTRN